MRFARSSAFKRRASKLTPEQIGLLAAALRRFARDPRDPILRTHRLRGELKEYWAFSVDRDLRVVFRWEGDEALLVTPGTHDEVYWVQPVAGPVLRFGRYGVDREE
jgi:mRNA-degrading endonuclease YafQ of YafQ-DinJ toxin-antitoxin module